MEILFLFFANLSLFSFYSAIPYIYGAHTRFFGFGVFTRCWVIYLHFYITSVYPNKTHARRYFFFVRSYLIVDNFHQECSHFKVSFVVSFLRLVNNALLVFRFFFFPSFTRFYVFKKHLLCTIFSLYIQPYFPIFQ